MEIISGIYKITNTITNQFYIGSSKNIKQRWKDHRKITTRKLYKNYPLYSDMTLYGLENFKFEIIERCNDLQYLKELEYNYICKLSPFYNIGKPWSKRDTSKDICGIYKITNKITNDFYIGSSKNIKERWNSHRRSYHWKNNPKTPLYKAIHNYGLENFLFDIIEECMQDDLLSREQYYINTLKPQYNEGIAKAALSKIEYQREYLIKNKEKISKYKKKNREYILERNKKYFNRKCIYNNEEYTLSKLSNKFVRLGIKNPVTEAKKYLI